MNIRILLGLLFASLSTLAWGGAAHALPCGIEAGNPCISDVLEATNFAGTILNDATGKPASVTLLESSPPPIGDGTGFVTIPFSGNPQFVGLTVYLTDGTLSNLSLVSDVVRSNFVGGGFFSITFSSDGEGPEPVIDCSTLQFPNTCLTETGQLQDITPLLLGQIPDFRVLVQSDVAEVPEPETLLLLGSGLAGLAALGRRRRV